MVIVKIYIIVSALVRIQAIEKLDQEKVGSNHKDTIFNKLYEPIEKLKTNTVIFSNYQVISKRYQPF